MLAEYPAFEKETYPPDEAERDVMRHVLAGVANEYATRSIPAMLNSLFLCRFVRDGGPDRGSAARAKLVNGTIQGDASKEHVGGMAEWKRKSLHRVLDTLAWSERVGYAGLVRAGGSTTPRFVGRNTGRIERVAPSTLCACKTCGWKKAQRN